MTGLGRRQPAWSFVYPCGHFLCNAQKTADSPSGAHAEITAVRTLWSWNMRVPIGASSGHRDSWHLRRAHSSISFRLRFKNSSLGMFGRVSYGEAKDLCSRASGRGVEKVNLRADGQVRFLDYAGQGEWRVNHRPSPVNHLERDDICPNVFALWGHDEKLFPRLHVASERIRDYLARARILARRCQTRLRFRTETAS